MNKDTKGYVSHRTSLVGRTLRGKGYSSSIVRSIIISSCLMKFQVFLVQETEGEDSQLKNISPGLHHFAQYFKILTIRIFLMLLSMTEIQDFLLIFQEEQ